MKKKSMEVYQANSFIESRQEYTRNEKRLLSTIISFVKPTDTEFATYEISIKEWAKTLNVGANNLYQTADEITDGLMSKIIKNKYIDLDGQEAFFKFHVLDTASYSDGYLTLQIHKNMNSILINLKKGNEYTHYELAEFITLTSVHAQRIYELIKQYQHSKKRNRIIELSELRNMLGLEKKNYKLFSDFRKKVLEVAYTQITENTTLRYKWKCITKRGRKVVAIEFLDIEVEGRKLTVKQINKMLETHIGEEIWNEEFNQYLRIKGVHKELDKVIVIDEFDNTEYVYETEKIFQENIAKAIVNKKLL